MWSRSWSARTSRSARRRPATSDFLRTAGEQFGFAVEGMSLVSEPCRHSDETVTFSSTYIRSCVDAGDVVAATEALGRPHRVEGVVVRGDGRGKVLGFPTANVAPPMYSAIPADGVYAAWFTVLGHGPVVGSVVPGERYQAAVSVGTNPTFSGRTRTVEAFVLDTAADLYGQHVAVDFVARIRGQEKFDQVGIWSRPWSAIPIRPARFCLRRAVAGPCLQIRRPERQLLDSRHDHDGAAVRGGPSFLV